MSARGIVKVELEFYLHLKEIREDGSYVYISRPRVSSMPKKLKAKVISALEKKALELVQSEEPGVELLVRIEQHGPDTLFIVLRGQK